MSADAVTDGDVARRAIGLLDLTDLGAQCGPGDIRALCARAVGPHGNVAAASSGSGSLRKMRRDRSISRMNAALSSSLSSSVLRMLSAIVSMLVARSSSAR